MSNENLLKIVEYGLGKYRNSQTNVKMNLIEYYSLTDLEPHSLESLAYKENQDELAKQIHRFGMENYWARKAVDMSEKLRLTHSIRGHELTQDEKLTIFEKLLSEGYPIVEGIYNVAARIYVNEGIDAVSKEKISEPLITGAGLSSKANTSKKKNKSI